MTRAELDARLMPLAERFACALLASPQSEYLTGKPERLATMSVLMAYQYAQAASDHVDQIYAARYVGANGLTVERMVDNNQDG